MDTLRILAVEDNPADFRLLTEYLGEDPSSRFEVVLASTLKEALAMLLGGGFAAVLLDLNLPDAHGLEVLEKVVSVKGSPAVIVLTGADNPEIGIRAVSKKAQDYLVKGKIDSDSLIRSIHYAIERNKAEESARQLNAELAKRAMDIEKANEALQASRVAALNLMEDALEARNKAERVSAELATVSERLTFAQQSAGAGTWDWDMISGKLDWSPELFRLFGLDPATPKASFDVWTRAILPEDRQIASERIEEAVQKHTRLVSEYRVATSTGEVRWINALGDTTYDNNAKPVRMSGICLDITDRKRAEARLAESEHRYRNLFTNMSEGFALHEIVCDDGGRPVDYVFLEVNPSFERLTGLKREQVLGKRVLKVLPQTEPIWIDRYGEVALTGEPCHFESFSAPLQRWFSVYAYCPDKRLFAVVFTDVTDVMKAQELEREALAMTTAARTAIDALEAMGEGVMVMDMDSIIRSVNPALEQMSGYPESEVQGKTLVELIGTVVAKEDQQAALESMRFALQRRPVAQRPLTFVSRNGRRIPVILATSFIEATHGKPTAFVVTVRDISELRATYQALEESEGKYRELVESANSIILRITPDHDILFFNEYAESFFGFGESEVLGKNVLGTIVPPVDSNGRDMKALMKAISENPAAYVGNENENVCKDGRRVWVHWTNRAIRDAQGAVSEILCVGVDVTQRKQLELERERYQQRLRELAERLASTEERERHRISAQIHDTVIQTLSLSNIKLGALRKALADAQLAGRAEEVNSARSMIEEAIKESRSLMAELTPPLLYELGVTPALQDLTQRLEKLHGIPIRVQDDGQPKPIDKPLQSSLFEVTRELIVNALKHAGQCTITIKLSTENDHLRVCVKDNGVGFEVPGDGRFVFHKSGGFGLFSVRERLDQIGGRLDVESQPGKGTTATILVPLSTTPK